MPYLLLRLVSLVFPVFGVLVVATVPLASTSASFCLNNNGDFNVPAGDTYNDGTTTWVCDPGAPGATSGGWVAAPSAPPPAVTPPPMPTTVSESKGGNAIFGTRLLIGGAAVAAIGATVMLFVRRASRRDGLRGDVRVAGGRRIDLTRYGRHASLGRNGSIPIAGDDVADHHAAVFARDGADWITPLDGQVRVGRQGTTLPVRQATQLSDGDRIDVGGTTVVYNNLSAGKPPETRKRGMPWLR